MICSIQQEIENLKKLNGELQSAKDGMRIKVATLEREQAGNITDALMAQKQGDQIRHENSMKSLKEKVTQLEMGSPSGGVKWKKFSKITARRTVLSRCRSMLSFMEKEIGSESFDSFVTELCNFVGKDPNYSFKTSLSDFQSYLASVQFKLSDSTLKQLKAFLTTHLGYDVFGSRKKIDELRKEHSALDKYKISVKSTIRKIGSREVDAETAIIEVKDLQALITMRLQRLHQCNQLRMEKADSPVVLGIGADKGGDHTKLVVIFGNVENANNPHGIMLIGMYEGDDSYESLKQNLSSVFEQVNNLETVKYREGDTEVTRPVKKIPIGDCKLLSSLLGHTGQSCLTPCFICDRFWTYRGQYTARVGSFDFSKAGDPYSPSALKEPLMNFHPDDIGPPGFHANLGITQTYVFNWFLALCNSIDCIDLPLNLNEQQKEFQRLISQEEQYNSSLSSWKTAMETVEKLTEVVVKFMEPGRKYVQTTNPCGSKFCAVAASMGLSSETFYCTLCKSHIHKVCSFENPEGVDEIQKCIDCQQKDFTKEKRTEWLLDMKNDIIERVAEVEDYLKDVRSEKERLEKCLKKCCGATRRRFEEVLRKIGCDLRTWYQQLTGNQARKLLKPENIKLLISVFPPDSSDKLGLMQDVMTSLGELMSRSNNAWKTDDEIAAMETWLEKFVSSLKAAQPEAPVIPKLHIYCSHLIPFLRVHRSLGHLNEQGLEHMHAVINSLFVRYSSVRNVALNASLVVKHLNNYNFIFDLGQSWFKHY